MFENNPTEILYPNLNKMHDDQRTTEQWRKKHIRKKSTEVIHWIIKSKQTKLWSLMFTKSVFLVTHRT